MINDGFIRLATCSPDCEVANPAYNAKACFNEIKRAVSDGANIVVLPECTMTSYVANDLLYQSNLLISAEEELGNLVKKTANLDVLFTVGLPLQVNSKLYNTVAVCHKGKILGIVPKTFIPTYGVDYEGRWFEKGPWEVSNISVAGQDNVPFGKAQLFRDKLAQEVVVGVEICEDIWSPEPPSIRHALAGATIICNSSASNASADKAQYREGLISGQSARLICCYAYCSSGDSDSTGDILVGGHDIIAANGSILAESAPFEGGYAIADIDVEALCGGRRGMSSFVVSGTPEMAGYTVTEFEMAIKEQPLIADIPILPDVPNSEEELQRRCKLVLDIQAHGLLRRLKTASATKALVIDDKDISSTLGKVITNMAFAFADMKQTDIQLVSRKEAEKTLKATPEALLVDTADLTTIALGYVQVLDISSRVYALNSGVCRTLIPSLIDYAAKDLNIFSPLPADLKQEVNVCAAVSPVKAKNNSGARAAFPKNMKSKIPVDVADFYLDCFVRSARSPRKTLRIAEAAFKGQYSHKDLLAYLKNFYELFFDTHYLRTNLPEGPRVGSITIGPRGFMMPSHPSFDLWMKELATLK